MGLKQTSIHTNFFPTSDVKTEDAGGEGSAAPALGGHGQDSRPAQTASLVPAHGVGENESSVSTTAAKVPQQHGKASDVVGDDLNNIILVDWDGPDDPENPMNWSAKKKWVNTICLNMMCLFIGLSTAAFSSGISDMVRDLNTSTEIGQVGMLVFNGAFALVPLVLGPLSEATGSRPVYLISMFFFVVWFIGLALSPNIGSVIVFRFLSGCSGAAGVTIIPGTLANIFATKDRAIPVALFSLVAVLGTVAAPLYAGFIVENKGWRWIQWVQMIFNGVVLLLLVVFLRENRGSVLLTRRAKKLRKETGDARYRSAAELETPNIKAMLHASTTKAALLLVREPVVLAFSLWLAYAWALIFASFSLIPLVYGPEGFGWNTGTTGLAYIGPIIGCFIAFGMSFYWKHLYDRAQANNGGVPVPEARLYGGACGGILCTLGLFITSFTSYNYLFWFGPQVGLCLMLIGIYQVFESVQAYLSDAYQENAASAIGAQGFVRNALAASFPLFSAQLFHNLHVWGGGLLLSCLLLIATPLPFILIKYGERIRERSPYAASQTGLTTKGNGDDEASIGGNGLVAGARRSRKDTARSLSEKKHQQQQQQQQQQRRTAEESSVDPASSSVHSANASGPQTRVPSLEVGADGEKKDSEVDKAVA
ncbi:unnamed protein product [Parajaminaea phylloscopi]